MRLWRGEPVNTGTAGWKKEAQNIEQDKNKFLINQFAASFSIIQHQSFYFPKQKGSIRNVLRNARGQIGNSTRPDVDGFRKNGRQAKALVFK